MTDQTVTAPGDDSEAPEETAPEAAQPEPTSDQSAAPTEKVEETVPEAPEASEKVDIDEPVEAPAPAAADPGETPAPAAAGTPTSDRIKVADLAAAMAELGELGDDLSEEAFADAVERTVVEFSEGSLISGTVVRIDPDEVMVDIGFKSEGVIPVRELSIRNTVNPNDIVSVGDPIEAMVLQMEDSEGRLILSKTRAQYERAWGQIEQIMESAGTVTGTVIEVVKGGLIVDIGLRGFLPASLVELRRVRDLHPYIGQPLEAKVIELDKSRNNVVLSRRAYLEEEQAEQRQAFLDELKEGEIRDGVVSSVVNFGAFVDLGGMDGLVHVSELSWQHVSHPSEMVSVGDKVTVKVLEVDLDRERISLSVRQTKDDPWATFGEANHVGDVVDGTVTKTVPFGAFVSVADGVEGLVHVSEIAMHHVDSPELELSVDQPVKVKITEIDPERRRISLSIKQAMPEWESRSQWQDDAGAEAEGGGPERGGGKRKRVESFEAEDAESDSEPEPSSFSADASLEAILEELKQRGIGRK
jgi:small subunit ribosomal protein S1